MQYLPPYSTLTTYGNSNVIQVYEPTLHAILRSLLINVEIDEIWYREKYHDVDAAILIGKFVSAREHYEKIGYFEGRFPRQITVEERWYLDAYADVKEAVRRGRFETGQEHFETDGFREGRLR